LLSFSCTDYISLQVSELKKKQEAQQQLLRQKQRSDDAAKRLQEEIHRIKSQKVQLQQKIKHESEQFRSWKAAREKEVLQVTFWTDSVMSQTPFLRGLVTVLVSIN
jgi:predicted  nucleic acid-binding Zn-ribbon protein